MTKKKSSLKEAQTQELSNQLMVKIPQTCKQVDMQNLEPPQNEESIKAYQEQYFKELRKTNQKLA